jgi:hypothetical protein
MRAFAPCMHASLSNSRPERDNCWNAGRYWVSSSFGCDPVFIRTGPTPPPARFMIFSSPADRTAEVLDRNKRLPWAMPSNCSRHFSVTLPARSEQANSSLVVGQRFSGHRLEHHLVTT